MTTPEQTVEVYEWLSADGVSLGFGTAAEFAHWQNDGIFEADDRLGEVIGREPASEDARRAAIWAAEAA
jgi:hypothetical protein